MRRGSFSFALVRVRAARSRLIGVDDLARLRQGPRANVLADLGLGGRDGDAESAWRVLFDRLAGDYGRFVDAIPDRRGRELIASLAGLHELENLKLVHRAVRRSIDPARWTSWWRPLGRIEELRLAELRTVRTAGDLVDRTARTRYADLVETIAVAARDTDDADRIVDRWGSLRIVRAARDLPRRDRRAAELALDLVRERDLDLLARAPVWGMDRALAARSCALVPDELAARPRESIADPTRRRLAIRDDRLDRCRRAFFGPPLAVAPAIALLMIEEASLAELVAVVESPPC